DTDLDVFTLHQEIVPAKRHFRTPLIGVAGVVNRASIDQLHRVDTQFGVIGERGRRLPAGRLREVECFRGGEAQVNVNARVSVGTSGQARRAAVLIVD